MCCNESISREPCCGQVDGAASNNTSCRNVKPIRHCDNCALCLYNVQPATQSLLLVYSQLQETRLYPKFSYRDVHFRAVCIQQFNSVNPYTYRMAKKVIQPISKLHTVFLCKCFYCVLTFYKFTGIRKPPWLKQRLLYFRLTDFRAILCDIEIPVSLSAPLSTKPRVEKMANRKYFSYVYKTRTVFFLFRILGIGYKKSCVLNIIM